MFCVATNPSNTKKPNFMERAKILIMVKVFITLRQCNKMRLQLIETRTRVTEYVFACSFS